MIGLSGNQVRDAVTADPLLGDEVRAQAERRLEELQAELSVGRRELREAERRHPELLETMLRISGAIQVLQELLGSFASNSDTRLGADSS